MQWLYDLSQSWGRACVSTQQDVGSVEDIHASGIFPLGCGHVSVVAELRWWNVDLESQPAIQFFVLLTLQPSLSLSCTTMGLLELTTPPPHISREEHATLTSSTPQSFGDIPPVLRFHDEVEVILTPGQVVNLEGRIRGSLWVTEAYVSAHCCSSSGSEVARV